MVDSLPREEPLRRLLVDLSGKKPPSPDGFQYLLMMVDDFSRFGWTYFQKKSDVPTVFGKFLSNIRARGTPSVVECLGQRHKGHEGGGRDAA